MEHEEPPRRPQAKATLQGHVGRKQTAGDTSGRGRAPRPSANLLSASRARVAPNAGAQRVVPSAESKS